MTIFKETASDPITGVAYVFPGDIDAETRISAVKVAITLSAGKTWTEIYFTPGSAQLTMEESTPITGRLIESNFEMKLPGGSADQLAQIAGICSRPIVLRLTFKSGVQKVCGGKNRKLRLHDAGTMGTQNSHQISFEYKSRKDFNFLDI